jgi:non-specific serine/threonine protein kinase
VWPVDPLDVPTSTASTDEIERSDAAALFLVRLPANLSTQSLRPDELAAVGAICRRLEGIPLALELAAARTQTLSLHDLANRLATSIDELAPHRHGAQSRHRTMRTALDWSYQLLTPPAQTALVAMSVFAGGCDLTAFTAICHDDDQSPAIEVLDELTRTSFATIDHTSERTRYRLLEPVRQYTTDLLDHSGATIDRHRRHLEHYLDVARNLTGDEHLPGWGGNIEGLRRELGNFRVALDWAGKATERTEAGLLLSSLLIELWRSGANHAEGLARIVRLLHARSGSAHARSQAARCAAFITDALGDSDQTLALREQALAEALAGADRANEVRARDAIAWTAIERGDFSTARIHLEAAGQIAINEADDVGCAVCMLRLAEIDRLTGNLDEATARVHDVLTGSAGSVPYVQHDARAVLGWIAFEQGDIAAARDWTTRALAVSERSDNPPAVTLDHLNLAMIECAARRVAEAGAHLDAMLALKPETAPGWDTEILLAQADLALYGESPMEAVSLAELALSRANEVDKAELRCDSLRRLGDAQLAIDSPALALATFQQLIGRANMGPYPFRVADGHEGAAAASIALGREGAARRHLASAISIRRRTHSRRLRPPAVEAFLAKLEDDQPGAGTTLA